MCTYVLLPQTFPFTGASTQGSLGIAAEEGVSHEVPPASALLCGFSLLSWRKDEKRGGTKKGHYGYSRKRDCDVVELCKTE